MNIFRVHNDPIISAQQLCDKHVVKMSLETVQLLCTAHRLLDGEEYVGTSASGKRKAKRWLLRDDREQVLYQSTHVNHPSAQWVRESVENYVWLADHLLGLCREYTYRYGKRFKVEESGLTVLLQSPPYNLRDYDETPFKLAMPDEYKDPDPVKAYRNYYLGAKTRMHRWTKRQIPDWVLEANPDAVYVP